MRVICNAFIAAFSALVIQGCATSGTTLLLGAASNPVPVDQVVVLTAFPEQYEAIALLKSEDGGANFNSNAKTQELCLKDLKARAAQVGANGLVLTNVGEVDDGAYLVPMGNSAVLMNSSKVRLEGTAIRFVPKGN